MRKQKLITRNLNQAQNIPTIESAIIQHESLRFHSKILHSWNFQIQQAKKAISIKMKNNESPTKLCSINCSKPK